MFDILEEEPFNKSVYDYFKSCPTLNVILGSRRSFTLIYEAGSCRDSKVSEPKSVR
jgi:hypothetical protein